MSAAKPIEWISEVDYLAGELLAKRKHEYAAGRVYMMAGGRTTHNRLGMSFGGIVYGRLRGKPCEPFNSDTKVRVRMLSGTRFYYPDGMIVCDATGPDEVFQDRPVVIAEVLSKSTRRIDEGEKRDAYLSIQTLQKYLLIEPTSPRVVAYERGPNGEFVARAYEGLDAVIPLEAAGIELPLAELYERVDFAAAAKEEADETDED